VVESKRSGQHLRPVITVPDYFEERLKGGYKVNYQKGTKQVTLFRNLIAAVCYEQGGVGIEEILVIYDLLEKLLEKTQKDKAFKEKYLDWLITVQEFLRKLSPREFPFVANTALAKEYEEKLVPYLPSRQAYFGWRRNPVRVTPASVRLRNPLAPPKKLPPKRFLGVGYRDKGNRRDPAVDATPDWKDVATKKIVEQNGKPPRVSLARKILILLNRSEI